MAQSANALDRAAPGGVWERVIAMCAKPSNVDWATGFNHPVGSRSYLNGGGTMTEGHPGGIVFANNGIDPYGRPYGIVASDSTEDGYYSATDHGEYEPGLNYHLGEDWNGSGFNDLGAPVYSVANGIVVRVGHDGIGLYGQAFGNYVVIKHWLADGRVVYSVYAHLDTINSAVDTSLTGDILGAIVSKDQQIGTIGATGDVTGPHLHFEMYLGEVATTETILDERGYSSTPEPAGWLDPTDFINANRVLSGGVDDYAAGTATTGLVTAGGGQVSGRIETTGDRDWFRLQVTQGYTYTVSLDTGSPPQVSPFLSDPFLYLYNSSGSLVDSWDPLESTCRHASLSIL